MSYYVKFWKKGTNTAFLKKALSKTLGVKFKSETSVLNLISFD